MGELILAFVTLTVLEIVLGIDNIVFISILVGKLPPRRTAKGAAYWLSCCDGRPSWVAPLHLVCYGIDRLAF